MCTRTAGLILATTLAACVGRSNDASERLATAARLAQADRPLASLFATSARLQRRDGTLASPEVAAGLAVQVGRSAERPLSVRRGAETLTLHPLRTRPVDAEEGAGPILYRDALPGADVLALVRCDRLPELAQAGAPAPCVPDRLELLLLVREPATSVEWSWRLETTPGLGAVHRDAGGALVFASQDGVARLRMPRPFALDAQGRRRDADLQVAGGVLTVRLDAQGLDFPLLLDPAVESGTWEMKVPPLPPGLGPVVTWDSARGRMLIFATSPDETWQYDGSRWWAVTPLHSPSSRWSPAMAFDSHRNVAVLFGGAVKGSQDLLEDTWEWDGTDWNLRTPATRPAARAGAFMTFDPERGRTVLLGGRGPHNVQLLDTWEWDGTDWSRPPASDIAALTPTGMAYHPSSRRTVVVGATATGAAGSQTWEWDGATWAQHNTTVFPASGAKLVLDEGTGRLLATHDNGRDVWLWDGLDWTAVAAQSPPGGPCCGSLAWDAARRRVMMFGGWDRADQFEWDGLGWISRWAEPDPRDGFAMAWDSTAHKAILVGGLCSGTMTGPTAVWEWDGVQWTKKVPAHIPGMILRPGLAYDPGRQRLVLFGGRLSWTGSPVGNTVEWDGVDWLLRAPPHSPSARQSVALTYDPTRQRVVAYGGLASGSYLSDLWEWDGSDWTLVNGAGPALVDPTIVYDEARQLLVAWGGGLPSTWEFDGSAWQGKPTPVAPPVGRGNLVYDASRRKVLLSVAEQVWEWDGTSWRQLSSGPWGRTSMAAVFDEVRARMVVVGGSCDQNYMETWEYHLRGGACGAAEECDTGWCVDGVCCESGCGAGASGDCLACSVEAGGAVDGLCTSLRCPAGPCRLPGTCDPALGACVAGPLAPDGTSCDGSDACNEGGSCQGGLCVPTPKSDGSYCSSAECLSMQACQSGQCTGGTPEYEGHPCTALNGCSRGTCAAGSCVADQMLDGNPCDDRDLCTKASFCQGGKCAGAQQIVCLLADACHVGRCDSLTGTCSEVAKDDGAACDDGDACTRTDLCEGGQCRGSNPVICAPADGCQGAASCDPSTGSCSSPPSLCGDAGMADAAVPAPDAGPGGADASAPGPGSSGCGCASTGEAEAGALAALLPLLAMLRRRRTAGCAAY